MQHLDLQGSLSLFSSRLYTLDHLLRRAEMHFEGNQSILDLRLAPDMLPLRTQVVFTCNQPRIFVLWCEGRPLPDSSTEVADLGQARAHIQATNLLLRTFDGARARVPERERIALGPGLFADMSAHEYVSDFLIPNFYFHLVTTYAILRMAGLPIGKADYMLHMAGHIRQNDDHQSAALKIRRPFGK